MMRVLMAAYGLQVNQAAAGGSESAGWTLLVAVLAAVAAIVSAVIAAVAASRSHAHSQSALAHSEKSLEQSEKAHAELMELERLKIHRLGDQMDRRQEEQARAEQSRFDANLKRFLDCMAKHDGNGTVGLSIDCGIATLFESDEEIRRVDAAYRKSHQKSPSVFGRLASEFEHRDAKKILDAWQAMSDKDKLAAGGLSVWIKTFPKKSS